MSLMILYLQLGEALPERLRNGSTFRVGATAVNVITVATLADGDGNIEERNKS